MNRNIKSKALFNKTCKIKNELLEVLKSLQFEKQGCETKKSLYIAIDNLRDFIDNIE